MSGRTVVASAVALALLGCGGGSDPTRDGPSRWSASKEPVLAIGRVEGDPRYLFQRVASALLLPDGGVAVADRGSSSIRVYDADGSFRVEMGGRGKGPGEFEHVSGLWRFGADTIATYDASLFRLTAYAVDGTLLSTVDIRGEGGRNPELFLGRFADGDLGLGSIVWSAERDPTAVTADLMPIARFAPDGTLRSTLVTPTGMVRHSNGPVPFSPRLHAVTHRDSIYFTDGLDGITVADGSGEIARTIDAPFPAIEYADARAALEARLEELRRSGASAPVGGWQREAQPPRHPVPRIADMLLDDEGHVWVKRYAPGTDSNDLVAFDRRAGGEWWVLEPDGRPVGMVRMPDRFTPLDVRGDRVAGVTRDELEVERVLVYEIVRTEAD